MFRLLQNICKLQIHWSQCGPAKLSKNKQLRSKYLDKEVKRKQFVLRSLLAHPLNKECIICVIFPACFSCCSTEQHIGRGRSSVLEESAQVNGSVIHGNFICPACFESAVKQGGLLLILRALCSEIVQSFGYSIEGIELCCTKTNIDLRVATVPDNTEIHYWTCFISVTVSEFQTPDIHCEQQRKASE